MQLGAALFLAIVLFYTNISMAAERPQGGTFNLSLLAEPPTLNPITSTDASASAIQAYILDSLLNHNPDTYDLEPSLAEKFEVSKDRKTFTFKLRDGLKFSDGSPLTVQDVKFSFDAIKDPKYKALSKLPYLDGISKCEIVDDKTVKFIAANDYFLNFETVSTLSILPQSVYKDPNAKLNKTIMGPGPYMLETYDKGKRIILKRNPHWWGWEKAKKDGEHNFDKIAFRFVDSPTVKLEMFKKGDIDFVELTPEQYMENTKGPEWGTKLIKVKTQNDGPKGFNWVGLNFKNTIFKDQKARLAVAMLMNRDLMIQKFRHGMADKTIGPGMLKEYEPASLTPILFDPKKALSTLKGAGWDDADKNGVLEKIIDGKKTEFKFEILIPTDQWTKYLTVFKEDAKKVGVEISIKIVEWNTFQKLIDEGKFDAITMAWVGGGIQWDPKQIWHSTSSKGGSNYISYSNPEVDKLIDQARFTWDRKKRAEYLKKINEMIANDVPYIFLFHPRYALYAHNVKIKKPKDTFRFTVGNSYWWEQK